MALAPANPLLCAVFVVVSFPFFVSEKLCKMIRVVLAGEVPILYILRSTKQAKFDIGSAREAGDRLIPGKCLMLYRKTTKLLHPSSGRCANLLSLFWYTVTMC